MRLCQHYKLRSDYLRFFGMPEIADKIKDDLSEVREHLFTV
jgi:hypothetical protein